MNVRHDETGTLAEGLLIRHLHGELDAREADAVAAHLASCDACRARAEALEASSRRVSDALRDADHAPPDRTEWQSVLHAARTGASYSGRGVHRLVAAAWILAFLAAAALAVAPVRAWVAGRWATLLGEGTGPAAPPAAVAADARAAVEFAAAGPALEVDLATLQAGGVLEVRFADAGTASLAVRGSGAAAVTVGADVVRIANDARESTEWRLIVPRDVERVAVRIGTRAPIVITRADDGADVALDSGRTVRNRLPRDEP